MTLLLGLLGLLALTLPSLYAQTCNVDMTQVVPKNDLDLDRMAGNWYEYKFTWANVVSGDIWVQYHLQLTRTGNNNFGVIYPHRDTHSEPCQYSTGSLTQTGAGIYRLYYTEGNTTTLFIVTATDYTNYLVAVGCINSATPGICAGANAHFYIFTRSKERGTNALPISATSTSNLLATRPTCLKKASWTYTEMQDEWCLGAAAANTGHIVLLVACSVLGFLNLAGRE